MKPRFRTYLKCEKIKNFCRCRWHENFGAPKAIQGFFLCALFHENFGILLSLTFNYCCNFTHTILFQGKGLTEQIAVSFLRRSWTKWYSASKRSLQKVCDAHLLLTPLSLRAWSFGYFLHLHTSTKLWEDNYCVRGDGGGGVRLLIWGVNLTIAKFETN